MLMHEHGYTDRTDRLVQPCRVQLQVRMYVPQRNST